MSPKPLLLVRYRLAGGVKLHRSSTRCFRADINDAVSLQRDIANEWLAAATVIDRAVPQHGGVSDGRSLGYRGRGQSADQYGSDEAAKQGTVHRVLRAA